MPVKVHVMLVACLLLLAGCKVDYESMAQHRVEYAKMNQGDVVIAAIEDADQSHYINGISLAVEEINQFNGGLLGRPLKLILEPGHDGFESSESMIRRIADNPESSITELAESDGGSCSRVRVGELKFVFTADESIDAENTCKCTSEAFKKLAEHAGFDPGDLRVDEDVLLSAHLLCAQLNQHCSINTGICNAHTIARC